jgi:hypothetical protein
MSNTAAPARTRKIQTAAKGAPTIPDQIKELARTTYKENLLKNLHNTKAEKARKDLYVQMKESKIGQFQTECVSDGKRVLLNVDVAAPESSYVDVAALKSLVTPEDFLKIVSATQAAVKEFAGDAILRQVLRATVGKENVSVKLAK